METNFVIFFVAALVPMVIGFIWYNPNVFGKAWMDASGVTEEQAKSGNMPVIFGVSYVLSLFLAFGLYSVVIHQAGLFSLLVGEPGFADAGSEINTYFSDFMAKYGTKHRTFGHGALHGAIGGFLTALPIIGTNALFERKGFKYIWVNVGYWIVTITLMGGVICAFA